MSATPAIEALQRQRIDTARAQITQGDLQGAMATLNQALQQHPNDPRVFMLAGLAAEKAGTPPNAVEYLRRCVSLAPEWGLGQLELALLLARQNQFQEALEIAEKIATSNPSNLQVLGSVIAVAQRARQLEVTVRYLRRALELLPNDAGMRRLLARNLGDLGEYAPALELWNALIDENPKDTAALLGRALALMAQGQPARARKDTMALLELVPGDSIYAYYNVLAHGAQPLQQPAKLIQELFDAAAAQYDQRMLHALQYQLPQQVAKQLIARYPDKKINVLDLGCGTGLLGVCLGRLDGALVGVDISKGMIEQAARHNVYDRFHHVNLLDALEDTPASLYQVLAALDVFIYAGDMSKAIPNALRILTPGGQFIFSCEAAPEDGAALVLQPSGRYAHQRSAIEALCAAAGFAPIEIEDTVLRHENNEPVNGFVVTAHKPA